MGEFVRRVRLDIKAEGHIPGPLQRNFTPQRWKKGFEDAGAPDEDDKDVFTAALVVHQKLNSIRARQKLSSAENLSATTKLRCFVAAANHNFVVARSKTRAAVAKAGAQRAQHSSEGFHLEELTDVMLMLPGGVEVTPNAVVEALVDGIEVPVGIALSVSPDLSGNPRMDKVKWDDIVLELNLGIFFRYAQDVWDDCLWNGYKVVGRDKLNFFVPKSPDFQRAHVLGISRRRALALGFTIVSKKFYREVAARGDFNAVREVRSIERHGKRQFIKLSKPGELTAAQEELMVLRDYASEPYYGELLAESASELGGLTLNDVLTGWTVVSRACQVLMESVNAKNQGQESKDDAHPQSWLPGYAPVLQVESLVAALGAAAGYPPQDARLLIDFLTYRGERGREIWAQPLVPVGPLTLAPVFAAVVSPNLRRLVDIWMRQAGIDLSKRGDPFEAHIRTTTREAIEKSKLSAGHAASIDEDYTFKPPGQVGVQFDLLFFIGATVILGESKCILEPTEAKGVAMHRKTVLEAADQAIHRVQIVESNRIAFVADIERRFGIIVPNTFKVVPLVVVSTSTHVGVPAKGVSVIDEYILERFLAGELEDVAVQTERLDFLKRVKTLFYVDAVEAEARVAEYFAEPPQMGRFKRGVGAELTPMPPVDENDWEGAVVSLYCRPKEGPLGFAGGSADAT